MTTRTLAGFATGQVAVRHSARHRPETRLRARGSLEKEYKRVQALDDAFYLI